MSSGFSLRQRSFLIEQSARRAHDAGLTEITRRPVDAVIAGIMGAAKRVDEVSLVGVGKFKVKDSPARQGRNPATGESIKIAASRKLGSNPAKQMKDALSDGAQ